MSRVSRERRGCFGLLPFRTRVLDGLGSVNGSEAVHQDLAVRQEENEIKFLLQEYSRLAEDQRATLSNYAQWYVVYFTAVAAAITVVVPLVQSSADPAKQSSILNALMLGLIVLGVFTFMGLSYETALSWNFVNAMKLIEKYFFERYPGVYGSLYFRTHTYAAFGSGVKTTLVRGATGGQPRSVVAIFNMILSSILVARLAVELGSLSPNLLIQVLIGVVTFGLVGILQLLWIMLIRRLYHYYMKPEPALEQETEATPTC